MWKEFLDEYDLDVDNQLDLEGSFFVGDAAGRPDDHSCVDRYVPRFCRIFTSEDLAFLTGSVAILPPMSLSSFTRPKSSS